MAHPTRQDVHKRDRTASRRTKRPAISPEEEEILRKAQIYLLFEAKRPMFWNVAGIRTERGPDGSCRWIIAVHLRAPSGHVGYLGDLLYDGARFTELTDIKLMQQRVRQIAASQQPTSPSV